MKIPGVGFVALCLIYEIFRTGPSYYFDLFRGSLTKRLSQNFSTQWCNQEEASAALVQTVRHITNGFNFEINFSTFLGRHINQPPPPQKYYPALILHRGYPSLHPFGVVHWVSVMLNIKTATGCESNRQLQL